MPFAETLDVFFADFGDAGTLAGASVKGIYDNPAGVELGGAITAGGPQYTLPTASVPAAYLNATLVIPQGTFKVREHLPDGTGVSLLLLTGPV